MSVCDNRSVFVVIRRPGEILALKRRKPPPGWAGVAGHVDQHGQAAPEDASDWLWPWRAAATDEVEEEAGLIVTSLSLITPEPVWRPNACRRQPGPRGIGHDCMLFEAEVGGTLNRSKAETLDLKWISLDELDELAQRTIAYVHGKVPEEDADRIELVWMRWYRDLGLISFPTSVLNAIETRARRRPWLAANESGPS